MRPRHARHDHRILRNNWTDWLPKKKNNNFIKIKTIAITNLNAEHGVEVMDDHVSVLHAPPGVFDSTHAGRIMRGSWTRQGAQSAVVQVPQAHLVRFGHHRLHKLQGLVG